jgi:hypothetical protein
MKLSLLHKLLAGIEGKRIGGGDIFDLLAGDPSEEGSGKRKRSEDEQPSSRKRKRNADNAENASVEGEAESGAQTPISQGWQDKDTFEQTQTTEDVDLNNEDRNPTANVEQPVTVEDEVEMMEVVVEGKGRVDSSKVNADGEIEETTSPNKISKEERNRRKREKKAEERRKKEAANKNKNK